MLRRRISPAQSVAPLGLVAFILMVSIACESRRRRSHQRRAKREHHRCDQAQTNSVSHVYFKNLRYRLKPIMNLLGGSTRLLELYRLVVVVCVLENVSEKVWRPMSLCTPKPISVFDFCLKTITLKDELKNSENLPSLNPKT